MSNKRTPRQDRRIWQTPELRDVGDVSQVLQFPGEGKLSLVADDSGDAPRKPKGQEPMM